MHIYYIETGHRLVAEFHRSSLCESTSRAKGARGVRKDYPENVLDPGKTNESCTQGVFSRLAYESKPGTEAEKHNRAED